MEGDERIRSHNARAEGGGWSGGNEKDRERERGILEACGGSGIFRAPNLRAAIQK